MRTLVVAAWAKKVATWCAAAVMGVAIVAASGAPTARACDTPVYRYAMYNWPAVPYRVFYYHHGQPAEADAEVNRRLGQLVEGEPAANVLLQAVDVSNKEQFEQYPPPVVEAWRAHGSDAATMHVVFSPWAVKLFNGRLDGATVDAMVDSPARKRLGELLHQGNVVVWLVLTGTESAENQRAEKVANEIVAAAAAGKIATDADADVDGPPAQAPPGQDAAASPKENLRAVITEPCPEAPPGEDAAASPKGLKAAVLLVSRSDPAETWLVRALLAVEPDLEKLTAEPMVFAIYGRGRAMPPCVGKGITVENLSECLEFLAGPCSCMVKEENPGVDLLMRWDWEATAEAMAAEDEALGGVPPGYREDMPGGTPATAAGEGAAASSASPESATPTGAPGSTAQARDAASAPAEAQEASAPSASGCDGVGESFAASLAWKIGIGLAVGGIVVVAAGLVLLRLQRPG